MKRKILVVIDCEDRARFFSRFLDTDLEVIAATPRRRYALAYGFKVERCSYVSICFNAICRFSCWINTITSSIDYHKFGALRSLFAYSYGYALGKKICKTHELTKCFIWNGAQAFSSGVARALSESGVETNFLELANVPGRIFSDRQGVNKQSSLFNDKRPLMDIDLNDHQVETFLEDYTAYLETQAVPQQYKPSTLGNKRGNRGKLLDLFSKMFSRTGAQQFQMTSTLDWYASHDPGYIFVPLQVSSDTQLVLNSRVNNQDLIKILLQDQKYKDSRFVLKFHPCDSQRSVNRILELILGDSRFKINQSPTYKLIEHCSEVITINSTVGMEARILNKHVTYFGSTIFEEMDRELILKYILGYLLEIDYFASESFSKDEVRALLKKG